MISFCDPEGRGFITKEAFIAFNKRKNFEWLKKVAMVLDWIF